MTFYHYLAHYGYCSNSRITDQATYFAVNSFFIINVILGLAWFFVFFGDGNLVAGLVILILMLVSVAILISFLGSDTWSVVILLLFFIWLCYVTALNWYAVTHNFIIRDDPPGLPLFYM